MNYIQDEDLERDHDLFWREQRLKRKTSKVYKYCSLVLFLVLVLVTSFDSESAECVTPRGGYFNETWQADLVYFTKDGGALATCTGTVIVTLQEYARLELLEQQNSTFAAITAELSTAAFTFGMFGYLMFWFIGFKGRLAKQAVKAV